MKDEIKKIGGISFVNTREGSYGVALNTSYDDMMHSVINFDGNWEQNPYSVGGVKVVPNGADNNLPAYIRNLLEKNNLGPGILARKSGLQYGKGPFLYKLKFEENEIVKEWVQDAEVQAWLDSWDYKEFVRNALQEFNYMQGVYVKYFAAKGRRLGEKWISKLECELNNECRLEWPNTGNRMKDVQNIIVYDFENMRSGSARRYPLFNQNTLTKSPVTMGYHSFRSFGRNFYALPTFIGSIPWIRRANDIPEIIEYLTNNMIAAAYHVHEPAQYWEGKTRDIQLQNPEWDEKKIAVAIELSRDELTKTIANVLAGKKNSGKFFESIDFIDENGVKCEWKIDPIETNVDKWISSQNTINTMASSAISSGFGLNPALCNIIIEGKGDSGSQILYAWKLFYAADTQIAEDIIFESIHNAMKVNFPNKKLSMGLYTPIAAKESDLSASARPTSKV